MIQTLQKVQRIDMGWGPTVVCLKDHKNRANGRNEGVKAGRNLSLGGGFFDYVVYIYICLLVVFICCLVVVESPASKHVCLS